MDFCLELKNIVAVKKVDEQWRQYVEDLEEDTAVEPEAAAGTDTQDGGAERVP